MDKSYIISQMKALSKKLCLDFDDEVYDSVIGFSEFKVYSKDDWKFKLKLVLFSLSPNVYYKLWKRFKNRI